MNSVQVSQHLMSTHNVVYGQLKTFKRIVIFNSVSKLQASQHLMSTHNVSGTVPVYVWCQLKTHTVAAYVMSDVMYDVHKYGVKSRPSSEP